MADDIVTRLRATTTVKGWYDDSPDVVFKNNPLCSEAADEIERLRKELEVYKDLYATELLRGEQ